MEREMAGIFHGLSVSEFIGLLVGGVVLICCLIYYSAKEIEKIWKNSR
jgi:hypothetical protein